MNIKTSINEKSGHIELKKKVIKLLEKREDILKIETEHRIRKEDKYYRFIDIYARKNNGGNIYVEIKTDTSLPIAIRQLKVLDTNNPDDEFMVVCKIDRLNYFKNIWRKRYLSWQNFINKTKIYIFNDRYELQHKDIYYKDGIELWVDGSRII